MSGQPVIAPIAWEDRYKVGIAAIDQDHQDLFRVYNEIALNLSTASDDRVRQTIITALGRYTTDHFRTEEELMLAIGYPEYHEHKAAHESFCEYLDDLATAFANQVLPPVRRDYSTIDSNGTPVSDPTGAWDTLQVGSPRTYIGKLSVRF